MYYEYAGGNVAAMNINGDNCDVAPDAFLLNFPSKHISSLPLSRRRALRHAAAAGHFALPAHTSYFYVAYYFPHADIFDAFLS